MTMSLKAAFVALFFALLFLSLVVVCHGQTNPPAIPVSPIATNAAPELPSSTADDIVKVLHDFHIELSATNVTLILLALSKLVQIARKYWVQSDASVIGKITKFAAVDSHPPGAVLNPIAPAPAGPPKV